MEPESSERFRRGEWRHSSRKMLQIEISCATVRMRETRRMCSGSCRCHSRPFLLDKFRREVNLEENINKTWKETLGFRELPKGVSGKNHFSLCNLSLCFHRHLCGPNGVNFPKDQVFYSLLHLRSFLITFPAPGIITLCPSLNWPRYFLNSYIKNTISQSNRKLSIFSGVVLFFGFL